MQILRNKSKFERSRGFTLIEMLVAVFIMITLTLVSVTNMRKGEQQKKLNFASDGVVNALRVAQNYALSGKVLPSSATCPNRSPAGYQVAFNASSNVYTLSVLDKCNTSPAPIVEQYTLPDKILFKSNSMNICSPSCSSSNSLVVRFSPPFGKMTVASSETGAFSAFREVQLTVREINSGSEKMIKADGISGQIGE